MSPREMNRKYFEMKGFTFDDGSEDGEYGWLDADGNWIGDIPDLHLSVSLALEEADKVFVSVPGRPWYEIKREPDCWVFEAPTGTEVFQAPTLCEVILIALLDFIRVLR